MSFRGTGWLAFLLVALLSGSAAEAGARPFTRGEVTPKARVKETLTGLRKRMHAKLQLDKLGVVVTMEAQVGYGTSLMADGGLVITPKDEVTHDRKAALFTSLEGEVFGRGIRGTLATSKAYTGIEQKYWAVRTGSAIYGDRITLPVIPEIVSIYAARSGGIGLRVTPFLLPLGLSFPENQLARWGFTVYVQHPLLAKVAIPVLHFYDRVNHRVWRPVKEKLTAIPRWMARSWRKFRGRDAEEAKPDDKLADPDRLVLREPTLDET